MADLAAREGEAGIGLERLPDDAALQQESEGLLRWEEPRPHALHQEDALRTCRQSQIHTERTHQTVLHRHATAQYLQLHILQPHGRLGGFVSRSVHLTVHAALLHGNT